MKLELLGKERITNLDQLFKASDIDPKEWQIIKAKVNKWCHYFSCFRMYNAFCARAPLTYLYMLFMLIPVALLASPADGRSLINSLSNEY